MAPEILMGNYLYVRFQKALPEKTCMSADKLMLSTKEPGFWANYLHDLESVWWIIIWTYTHFLKASDVESKSLSYELEKNEKKTLNDILFPGLSEERWKFLATGSFYEYLDGIPKSFPRLKRIAKFMKSRLLSAYYARENSMDICEPILVSDECTLHRDILEGLRMCPFEDINVVPIWQARSKCASIAPDSKLSMKEETGDTRGIEGDIK